MSEETTEDPAESDMTNVSIISDNAAVESTTVAGGTGAGVLKSREVASMTRASRESSVSEVRLGEKSTGVLAAEDSCDSEEGITGVVVFGAAVSVICLGRGYQHSHGKR